MNQESASAPRISVAMATYNGGAYLQTQIASILAQHRPPDEIVICDDGSTDGTPALLSQLHSEGKIRFFPNEKRLGVTGNFKRAVSLCREGNYIALSDQDDYWMPEKLSDNAALLAGIDDGRTPALIFSDLEMTDATLRTLQPSFWQMLKINPGRETLHSLLFGNIVTGCTTLINPSMAGVLLAMPDDGRFMHDAWMGMAGYSFGKNAYSPKPLVRYRQHGGNVTFDTNQQATMRSRAFKNIRQLFRSGTYLQQEAQMARAFYDQYRDRMAPYDQSTFRDFLHLADAGFLRKKTASLRARSYRYTGGL